MCLSETQNGTKSQSRKSLYDQANARLIAAAPDLLAACEALTAALDAIATVSDYLPGERNRNLQAAREQVRAAIAKAK